MTKNRKRECLTFKYLNHPKHTLYIMPKQMNVYCESFYRDWIIQFLLELMNVTQTAATPEACQDAVQTYCDELRP